jgi:hypothetical protein
LRRPSALACAVLLATGAASPVHAQDLGAARAFVAELYAGYGRKPEPDYVGRQAAAVFSPRLVRLMRRDAARAKGEVGALDGDPICDCQDYEIKRVEIAVAAAGAGRATATVRFRNFGEARTVTLDLVRINRNWRVDDTHSAGTPSLVGLFTEGSR